jgi:hypothetical protein
MCIPCTPIVQSRYDSASSKSVSKEILRGCQFKKARRRMRGVFYCTYPHSRLSSSRSSIFLNLESPKALISAYSASPSLNGSASKLPMHPLNLGARPGREERAFQVTNNGLQDDRSEVNNACCSTRILFIVWKAGSDWSTEGKGAK